MLLSLPRMILLFHGFSNSYSSFKTQLRDFLWKSCPQHCRWSAAASTLSGIILPTYMSFFLYWERLEIKDLCPIHHDHHISWNWVIAQWMPVKWSNTTRINGLLLGWMERERERWTFIHDCMHGWNQYTSGYINLFNGGSDGVFICNPEGL